MSSTNEAIPASTGTCLNLLFPFATSLLAQVTNHKDEIEIVGGGLPTWNLANDRSSKRARGAQRATEHTSHPNSKVLSGEQGDPSQRGSLVLTCHVIFPGTFGKQHGKAPSDL